MKKILAIVVGLIAMPASAQCLGSGAFTFCSDASGNSYTTTRVGNQSYTTGTNSRTGSSWNQSTSRVGDWSFTQGQDARGRSWNSTTNPLGFTNGIDADGNSYSRGPYDPK